MLKEKVGTVVEEEKDCVLKLYERKLALDELMLSLNNPSFTKDARDELYEKIVADVGQTKLKMQNWWNDMHKKYQWKGIEGGNWNIDFQTNEIFLVKND